MVEVDALDEKDDAAIIVFDIEEEEVATSNMRSCGIRLQIVLAAPVVRET